MSISFPHFLYGDPKLVSDVVGLNPDPELHSFYMDFQPVGYLSIECYLVIFKTNFILDML